MGEIKLWFLSLQQTTMLAATKAFLKEVTRVNQREFQLMVGMSSATSAKCFTKV